MESFLLIHHVLLSLVLDQLVWELLRDFSNWVMETGICMKSPMLLEVLHNHVLMTITSPWILGGHVILSHYKYFDDLLNELVNE